MKAADGGRRGLKRRGGGTVRREGFAGTKWDAKTRKRSILFGGCVCVSVRPVFLYLCGLVYDLQRGYSYSGRGAVKVRGE